MWRNLFGLVVVLLFGLATSAQGAEIADPRAWMTDGPVFATGIQDGVLYVGGAFNYIGPRTGCVVDVEQGSGRVLPAWPEVEGAINAVASDGAGGWYVGGSFLTVGGLARSRLAHFRADGSMDPWAPDVDGVIHAVEVVGDRVLVGGEFRHVAGADRRHLAAVDRLTGMLLPWNPSADRTVWAMSVTGGRLYVGGEFTSVGEKRRSRLAALDLETGAATDWTPCVGECDSSEAYVLTLMAAGNALYVGGSFSEAGGAPRRNACAFDAQTAELLPWAPELPYEVRALAHSGGNIIIGGSFGTFANEWRCEIAAVDSTTGGTFSFRVSADQDVRAFRVEGGTLYVGGSFFNVNGARRLRAAAIDLVTGGLLPWAPNFAGPIVTLASDGSNLIAGGTFESAGGVERLNLGAISLSTGEATDWAPRADLQVDALLLAAHSVYVGGVFRWAGGRPREHIAELDLETGAATDWDPGITAQDYAAVFDMALHDGTLYVAGDFTHVGGFVRRGAAAIDARTGAVSPWDPALQGRFVSGRAVEVSGSTVYLGGSFDRAGGALRRNLAALDAATAAALAWDPSPDYEVDALALDSGRLLVGGGFWSIGGAERRCLAEVDTATGLATGWNPRLGQSTGLPTVLSVLPDRDQIHVAGQFASIGGQTRNDVARLGRGDGTPLRWDARVGGYAFVMTLVVNDGTEWMGGEFQQIAGHLVSGLVHVVSDEWPPTGTSLTAADAPMVIAEPFELRWDATDDVGVLSVDIHLSRSGPDGPWEPIALACKNVGRYVWTPTGPTSTDACLRFDIHDFAGNVTQVKQTGMQIAATRTPGLQVSSLELPRPNPVSDAATISYTVWKARPVRITLLDMQGRIRETIVDRIESAGAHSAVLRTAKLTAGMYWIRMETLGFSESRRFVLRR